MVKTAAEYQRDYRERKKRNDPSYLDKERKRQDNYRKGINELSKKDQKKRRDRSCVYSYSYREKQKLKKTKSTPLLETLVQSDVISSSSEAQSSNTNTICEASSRNKRSNRSTQMFVRMAFPMKSRKSSCRTNALKKANNKIFQLKQQMQKMVRCKRKFQKRCERIKQKLSTTSPITPDPIALTPKSKTKLELREAGLSPRRIKNSIVKKLIMTNALIDEVKETKRVNKSEKARKVLAKIVSGKIVKKYRCMSIIARETKISGKVQRKATDKSIRLVPRKRMESLKNTVKARVIEYLERDDVSRMMPGKDDVTKSGKEKVQKRILNDYMSNLYEKFKSEIQDVSLSFSSFCKLRPNYIHLTSVISRNICLCSRHQSFAMKLKCLREAGIKISPNPESVVKNVSEEDLKLLMTEIQKDKVEYEEWQKVEESDRKRLRVVKVSKTKTDFQQIMMTEYADFIRHTDRVRQQFKALKDLKENLSQGHVIVQMDFAENFTCQAMDEIQSAYFNTTGVTIHPVVVYFKTVDNIINHKSFVFVSDVNQHKASAVLTIIDKLMPELKLLCPDVKMIHYWTDSPTSQYRNKVIFDMVRRYEELYGIHARWNYFESGHGKGPCDGVGGTAKRQAADAVKQGKVQIQDATDFFKWSLSNQKSLHYIFYGKTEFDDVSNRIPTNLKPVPGTMKLHAVLSKDGSLFTRPTSCYCFNCLEMDDNMCEGWVNPNENCQPAEPVAEVGVEDVKVLHENDYVVAIYEDNWYVGKIMAVNQSDNKAKITFMEAVQTKDDESIWPAKPDVLWVNYNDILSVIEPPVSIGKSQRQYKIDRATLESIISNANKQFGF